MLHLAVTTASTTFERMRKPLAARDITVRHLPVHGRTFDLDHNPVDEPYDVGYVFPSRQVEGDVVEALYDIPWVNDRAAVLRSRNKAGILARVNRAGIPTPASTLVSSSVEESTLVDVWKRFDPPVVVKPNSSTRGAGVTKVHDLDSFLGLVDYFDVIHDIRTTRDKSFLVQEYVPDARDVRVMVVDGEYVGAVEREAGGPNRWKHNVHRGGEARGIDIGDEVRKLAEEVATVTNVPVVGVDFLVTPDRIVLTETNARPTIDEASKYEDGFWDRLASAIRRRA